MIGKRFLDVQLKADERIDDLERNGYGIIQKKDGFGDRDGHHPYSFGG